MLARRRFVALALASSSLLVHAQQSVALEFVSLEKGSSGIVRSKVDHVVARTREALEAAWKLPWTDQSGEVLPPVYVKPPTVDFAKEMVIGVILPSASNSCTGVTISEVLMDQHRILVTYHARRHQPREICLASFTTPYHYVTIPASSLPVEFMRGEDA